MLYTKLWDAQNENAHLKKAPRAYFNENTLDRIFEIFRVATFCKKRRSLDFPRSLLHPLMGWRLEILRIGKTWHDSPNPKFWSIYLIRGWSNDQSAWKKTSRTCINGSLWMVSAPLDTARSFISLILRMPLTYQICVEHPIFFRQQYSRISQTTKPV